MVVSCALWRAMGAGRMAMLARAGDFLSSAQKTGARVALLPALCTHEMGETLIAMVREFTQKHPGVAVCPGSAYAEEGGAGYHVASLYMDGEEILHQRQIYLSRWEREAGLSRGAHIQTARVGETDVAIVLSTDALYPQVSRAAADQGARLLICPSMRLSGGRTESVGMWQIAQQMKLFTMESPYCGRFLERDFSGRANICAPLKLTEDSSGCLSATLPDGEMILAELPLRALNEARAAYERELPRNRALTQEMFLYGRGRAAWG